MPDREPFDPLAEAHRQWQARWPDQAERMAAVTSVMRVQQLLLARVEGILKPYGITFATYEALPLLAFTRTGSLPMGKLGARLMVHPAAVTNAIGKLEQRNLVQRSMSPETGASSWPPSPATDGPWSRRRPPRSTTPPSGCRD